MKPKARAKNYTSLGKSVDVKIPKKELPSDEILKMAPMLPGKKDHQAPSAKPSVQIVKCISFQKFRYSGENRPGKKYQEKEFMTLQLNNLADKAVRVVIICTDADNRELIHPNGLVGKDCHHGIYDKEYAVNKACHQIKIPYLRTERIKINAKKDEHKNTIQENNIQSVLSQRASHLPSPYKERCLSQCTDKYTSGRKFDTTKVCLGVIITVQDHSGEYNGSLHAISHMVRNASEKTSLEIRKLSQLEVPAWDGALVDIFTNEEGPAIEPDKCHIYVTLVNVPEAEDWRSETFVPIREDILYKKVITYRIPAIAPNYDISTPVTALLHLECPQSNQYCTAEFKYTPLDSSQAYVCIDNLSPTGTKRAYGELQVLEDVKPSLKKLKLDSYLPNAPMDVVKANLKSKLQARQENSQGEDERSDVENQVSANGDGTCYIADHHYPQEHKGMPGYVEERHMYIHHKDPQTGKATLLLDMDAGKTVEQHNTHTMRTSPAHMPFQSHSQDVKVVATGYSDAVPPNTTVLIYTTNNGVTEQVPIDSVDAEHMIIGNAALLQTSQFEFRDKENRQEPGNSQKNLVSVSEQVVRREAIELKQGTGHLSLSPSAMSKTVEEANSVMERKSSSPRTLHSSAVNPRAHHNLMSNNREPDRNTPEPDKASSSSIPDIRRIIIPQKVMPETSPWEVGSAEDAEAYRMCLDAAHYEAHTAPRSHVAVKREEPGSPVVAHRNEHQLPNHHGVPFQNQQEYSSKLLDENDNNSEDANSNTLAQGDRACDASIKTGLARESRSSESDYNIVSAVANLPTFEVSQLAHQLIGLDSVDVDGAQTS